MIALRIIVRGRRLAQIAWEQAKFQLVLVPKPHLPERLEFRGLEEELGRALSTAEETIFIHAYRSELHALNAERELYALARAARALRRQP